MTDYWAGSIARSFFGDQEIDIFLQTTPTPDLPVFLHPIEHNGTALGLLPPIDIGLSASRRLTGDPVTVNVLTAGVSAFVLIDPPPDLSPREAAQINPLLN